TSARSTPSTKPAPSPACPKTKSWTRSSRRSAARLSGPDRAEHGDRPRLDRRLPGSSRAFSQLADGAAVRAFRRRELPRLRRALARAVLRAPAHLGAAADDVAAHARRLSEDVRGAGAVRPHLLAAHLVGALRDVPERDDSRCRARREGPH